MISACRVSGFFHIAWSVLKIAIFFRIPAKSNQTLCCLLRGPVDTIAHLKISYKKRNHSRHSLIQYASDKLLSDIIEIDNLAKAGSFLI